MEPIELGVTEAAPGRPFTSVDLYSADKAALGVMLCDLCDLLEDAMAGLRTVTPYGLIEWREQGLRHRIIVCNQERLLSHESLCAVGFHSERHTDVDIGPLEAANRQVVEEFPDYPGVLSYSSLEIAKGRWANLVLHEEPETAEHWRESRVHAEAVERLSPIHYRNVRIHNARITDALSGDPDITIVATKYYDYESGDGWRAVRRFPEPLVIDA